MGSPDPEVAVPGPEPHLGTFLGPVHVITSFVSLRWCGPVARCGALQTTPAIHLMRYGTYGPSLSFPGPVKPRSSSLGSPAVPLGHGGYRQHLAKRRSPAPSRYGRGAVGQLGVLSLPMQRPSFPFGLGPPLGQGWRAVKGPGPSRTSGWLVFCRLAAVYVCSETSNK